MQGVAIGIWGFLPIFLLDIGGSIKISKKEKPINFKKVREKVKERIAKRIATKG